MHSPAFHRYSLVTLAVGLVLIWWGAAVTTEDVGLAVPDWPLCYGKINPEGWYKVPALLLEHGHRWIATTIGFLVLGMYYWQFAKFKPGLVEGVVQINVKMPFNTVPGQNSISVQIGAVATTSNVTVWVE